MTPESDTRAFRGGPGHMAAATRRRYVFACILLLLAVLAGFVLGVSSTVLYFERNLPRRGPNPGPEGMARSLVSRMEAEVSISDAERGELMTATGDAMREVETVREDFSDRMRTVFQGMNVKVERILGPERYTVWSEARDRHFAEQARRDRRHWYHKRRERERRERSSPEEEGRTGPPSHHGGGKRGH